MGQGNQWTNVLLFSHLQHTASDLQSFFGGQNWHLSPSLAPAEAMAGAAAGVAAEAATGAAVDPPTWATFTEPLQRLPCGGDAPFSECMKLQVLMPYFGGLLGLLLHMPSHFPNQMHLTGEMKQIGSRACSAVKRALMASAQRIDGTVICSTHRDSECRLCMKSFELWSCVFEGVYGVGERSWCTWMSFSSV